MRTPRERERVKKLAEGLAELRDTAAQVVRSQDQWRGEGDCVYCGQTFLFATEAHLVDYIVALHNAAPDLFTAATEKL